MKNSALPAALLISVVAAAGCATRPATPREADLAMPFVIERDLAGKTVGRGRFKSITGADRAFTAYLDGAFDGETLILVEDFEYDDGEKDKKTWRLTRRPDGEWTGTREDVVGEARGYQDGAAFRLEYRVDIPVKNGGTRRVGFRDVLIRREDGVIFNKANVGWRGLAVGGVELEIRRVDPPAAR